MAIFIRRYSYSEPINNGINKYENYLSVKKISGSNVHFSNVDKDDAEKTFGNHISSKVETFKNIPIKCLDVTPDICSPFLAAIWKEELILD